MKDYSVSVEVSFSIQATTEKTAQDRAQQVVEALSGTPPVRLPRWWPDDLEFAEPQVEEA